MTGIYKINIQDKYYIGSSQNVDARIKSHRHYLYTGGHVNRYMQNAYNKHQNLTYEILEECSIGDLLSLEQKYIDLHYDNASCMNLNEITGGGMKYWAELTPEERIDKKAA